MPPPAQPQLAPADPQLRGGAYEDWGNRQDPAGYDLGSYGMPPEDDMRRNIDPRAGYEAGAPWHVDHGNQPDYPAGHHDPDAEYDDDDYYDDEDDYDEPRRGGRRWLIAAALVGSIGLGGGLAYVYKNYVADGGGSTPQIVRASKEPTRSVPDTPDGKQFANQGSKVLGRLGSEQGTLSNGDVDANGVRRVSTLTVGPDGTVTSAVGNEGGGSAPGRPTVQVPGVTFDLSSGGGLVPPPPPAVSQSPSTAPPGIAVGVSPERGVPPPPSAPVNTIAPTARPTPAPPPPVRSAAVTPRPPATRSQPAAPPARAVTPARKSTGYVAVLSSKRTRMEALTTFADLQQKYRLLQGKVPDVMKADLSSRGLGTMYRLVVGPPASRSNAAGFCKQIRAAGHGACWVTPY